MEKLKRPFYTVIVPARNEADYILATLLSVKKQKTSKDFDILVIDNGSVDNTADICKSAGYKVVHEPVAGLPKARETGRQNAKGQYLIYIDADTTMPENYLETMADAIDQYPDAVALSNGFNFYDGSVAQNFIIAGYFKLIYPLQSFILWLIGSSKQVIGGSFVVKAEALENIGGFNTDIEFFGEDTEISKRLGKLGKIVFTKKVRVATSARRFKIDGTVITSFVYVKNYLSMTLFNRRSDNGLLRQATKLIFLAASLYLAERVVFQPATIIGFDSKIIGVKQWIEQSRKHELVLLIIVIANAILAAYNLISPRGGLFGEAIQRMNTSEKLVALTFDDGPTAQATSKVIQILNENNIKATFFVIGERVVGHPEIVQSLVRAGHDIGLHAYAHRWLLPFRSKTYITNDIQRIEKVVAANVPAAQRPKYYRPPHGWKTPWLLRTVSSLGYKTVLWNIITPDFYESFSSEKITKRIIERIKPGSIIVLHDGVAENKSAARTNMLEALPNIIKQLNDKGYMFVLLKDLL